MNEQQWLTSEDPVRMLERLHDPNGYSKQSVQRPSDRKLRLFALACWWGNIQNLSLSGHWLGVRRWGEDWIDRGAPDADVLAPPSDNSFGEPWRGWLILDPVAEVAARYFISPSLVAQAALLRDIVGNPWKPCVAAFSPQVLSLAKAAYDERGDGGTLDNFILSVLADAMEDAGCDSVEILDHLRGAVCPYCEDADFTTGDYGGPILSGGRMQQHIMRQCACKGTRRSPSGPHVRGCWVLDLILGKGQS